MTGILEFIRQTLEETGIPYEYGEWTSPVQYPYFVGSFEETDYRFEDNCTEGTFTLNGWTRGPRLALSEAADKIRDTFADLQTVVEDRCFYIRFGGVSGVPTSDAGLYRITITLYTSEWKGA